MVWRGDGMEGRCIEGRWYGREMVWMGDGMEGRWYGGEMVWRGDDDME